MKLELFIVLIVSIFAANIYYDGKILAIIKCVACDIKDCPIFVSQTI
jgi:hypothetical protein